MSTSGRTFIAHILAFIAVILAGHMVLFGFDSVSRSGRIFGIICCAGSMILGGWHIIGPYIHSLFHPDTPQDQTQTGTTPSPGG